MFLAYPVSTVNIERAGKLGLTSRSVERKASGIIRQIKRHDTFKNTVIVKS